MTRAVLPVGLFVVFAAACSPEMVPQAIAPPPAPGPLDLPSVETIDADLAGLSFEDFVDRSFLHLVRRSPQTTLAWQLEERFGENAGRLDDLSQTFAIETNQVVTTIQKHLSTFDPAALSEEQGDTHAIFAWYLDDLVRSFSYRDHRYQATHFLNGEPVATQLFFTELHPLEDEADARSYVARLWGVDDKLAQLEVELERRATLGLLPPKDMIDWIRERLGQIASATSPPSTPYYATLRRAVDSMPNLDTATRTELIAEANAAVRNSVIPAYVSLRARLVGLRRNAPSAIGVGTLPDGEAYYNDTLRHHTTTSSTADEIHALGLDELDRIHAEIRTRFRTLGYPDGESLEASFARVVEDGGLVAGDEVVRTYTEIIDAAYERLGEAFDVVPSSPVVVIGGSSGGFYISPSLDGARPGAFYAVAGGGPQPRFGMATLAYHEAVPGHHHQIGIALDLDLPFFRRVITYTAFAEGWALYAERLAYELGWYDDDPYGDLGRLQAEAFRAARLVVDTGIHAQGWTFERARDFFADNTGFDPRTLSADGQIARYTAWPGQATAYAMGMCQFLGLRTRAEAALGTDFDLVAFHRMVLTAGSVPLPILERRVDRWITSRR